MLFRIVPDLANLASSAVDLFKSQARVALQLRPIFTVVLSGGSTPQHTYRLLAELPDEEMHWSRVHFFWGDERCVLPDHPDSNFKMAWDLLLSKIPIPKKNIHRIQTEIRDPNRVAQKYEDELRDFFSKHDLSIPRFDLALLGIGEDGHTASLFPDGDPCPKDLMSRESWVTSIWVPHLGTHRISLTPAALNMARQVAFLVSGFRKAKVLSQILSGESEVLAAQLIQPKRGKILWITDHEAGSCLRLDARESYAM